MKQIVDPLSRALFDSDLVCARLTLAFAEMCWFLMLLWPGDTFDRPTYTVMANAANEMIWAAIFGVTSFLQFSIVLRNAFNSEWARVFATWNAGLWVFIVGSMLVSVYPPPAAVGGDIALMVAAVWIWARPLVIERGLHHAH